jgi:hypothetical protein
VNQWTQAKPASLPEGERKQSDGSISATRDDEKLRFSLPEKSVNSWETDTTSAQRTASCDPSYDADKSVVLLSMDTSFLPQDRRPLIFFFLNKLFILRDPMSTPITNDWNIAPNLILMCVLKFSSIFG